MPINIKQNDSWSGVSKGFVKVAGVWKDVTTPDLVTNKNFVSFTGSSSVTTPSWASTVTYLIVRGGNSGSGTSGGAGGQVLQGSVTAIPNATITVTVGGTAANSSIAISGGSTVTANTTGAGAGANGTLTSGTISLGYFGGGGGPGCGGNCTAGVPGFGRGGRAGHNFDNAFITGGGSGDPNSGGGGGGGSNSSGPGSGGSGIVVLYFS
jgi:hypothetical protein